MNLSPFVQERELVVQAEKLTELVVKAHAETLVKRHMTRRAGSAFCKSFEKECEMFRNTILRLVPEKKDILHLDDEDLYMQLVYPLAHIYHKR